MRAFGISHPGKVRKENQDRFRFEVPRGQEALACVLCDGMGGAQAGSVASELAAETFMSHAGQLLTQSDSVPAMRRILKDAVRYANIKVYDRSYTDFSCMGMGSTLVALVMNENGAVAANVGDSRAYLFENGRLEQVTQDHSYVAEQVRQGKMTSEEAENHPQKNIITRAIGVEASVRCDVFELDPAPGSRFLLCSDGLSNVVRREEMEAILAGRPDDEEAARVLLALTLERGAPDNVTVLIAGR